MRDSVYKSKLSHEQVGVYQNFLNLRATAYYLADIPPDQKTYGIDGDPTLFSSNKPVYFDVTDDNNGKVFIDLTLRHFCSLMCICVTLKSFEYFFRL